MLSKRLLTKLLDLFLGVKISKPDYEEGIENSLRVRVGVRVRIIRVIRVISNIIFVRSLSARRI